MPTPIIGITTRKDLTPAGLPAVMLQQAYTNAIIQAGGAPVLIPSDLPEAGWRELFQRLDGILFTGGGDIAVEHFKGEAHPKVTGLDEARDAIELGLVRSVVEAGKPFLGICRGLQATNVALGGTLYTDILDQVPNALQHDYQDADIMKERTYLVHPVRVEEGSRIGGIFGQPMFQVNSLHHQGIKELAPRLKAVGFAPGGLIEAGAMAPDPLRVGRRRHPQRVTDQESIPRL